MTIEQVVRVFETLFIEQRYQYVDKSKSRLTTGFSLKSDFPTTHPATHPGKFQISKIQQYIQNKSCQYRLGGYETCFGIRLDPKTIHWESKRAKNLSTEDFFNPAKQSNIYKQEADILQQLSMFYFNFQICIFKFQMFKSCILKYRMFKF